MRDDQPTPHETSRNGPAFDPSAGRHKPRVARLARSRPQRLALALAGGVLLAWCAWNSATGQDSPFAAGGPSPGLPHYAPSSGEGHTRHYREGTPLVDVRGQFATRDERVIFVPDDGSTALTVLENLGLERVLRASEDSPELLRWSIRGSVTEFGGANYLLLSRAVVWQSEPRR